MGGWVGVWVGGHTRGLIHRGSLRKIQSKEGVVCCEAVVHAIWVLFDTWGLDGRCITSGGGGCGTWWRVLTRFQLLGFFYIL